MDAALQARDEEHRERESCRDHRGGVAKLEKRRDSVSLDEDRQHHEQADEERPDGDEVCESAQRGAITGGFEVRGELGEDQLTDVGRRAYDEQGRHERGHLAVDDDAGQPSDQHVEQIVESVRGDDAAEHDRTVMQEIAAPDACDHSRNPKSSASTVRFGL